MKQWIWWRSFERVKLTIEVNNQTVFIVESPKTSPMWKRRTSLLYERSKGWKAPEFLRKIKVERGGSQGADWRRLDEERVILGDNGGARAWGPWEGPTIKWGLSIGGPLPEPEPLLEGPCARAGPLSHQKNWPWLIKEPWTKVFEDCHSSKVTFTQFKSFQSIKGIKGVTTIPGSMSQRMSRWPRMVPFSISQEHCRYGSQTISSFALPPFYFRFRARFLCCSVLFSRRLRHSHSSIPVAISTFSSAKNVSIIPENTNFCSRREFCGLGSARRVNPKSVCPPKCNICAHKTFNGCKTIADENVYVFIYSYLTFR